MAAPIRTMLIIVIVVSVWMWAMIGYTGSYEVTNNIPLNATLRTQYEVIVGNSSGQGVFGASAAIENQTSTQGMTFGGVSSYNTVSMISQFFTSIPAEYNAWAFFIATPLTWIGIPVSQPIANILFLVTILVFLGILSAIFLFPI